MPAMRNRVKELRKAKGWSLARLGERIGANRSQVWKLENGRTRLNTDWMAKIAKALDVQPADLLVDDAAGKTVLTGAFQHERLFS